MYTRHGNSERSLDIVSAFKMIAIERHTSGTDVGTRNPRDGGMCRNKYDVTRLLPSQYQHVRSASIGDRRHEIIIGTRSLVGMRLYHDIVVAHGWRRLNERGCRNRNDDPARRTIQDRYVSRTRLFRSIKNDFINM